MKITIYCYLLRWPTNSTASDETVVVPV